LINKIEDISKLFDYIDFSASAGAFFREEGLSDRDIRLSNRELFATF
jgi:hypothetical protein